MNSTRTASFATLPNELRVSIIEMACQDDYDFAGVSGKKALNLMLTSRDTYAITAPLLYKNIKITKPSVLADFERALTFRPALGLLVKSLYLGPDRHLPHDWWPIKNCEPEAAAFGWQEIKTSLKDETQLPRGSAPVASWLLKSRERRWTPLSDAIVDAVEAAQTGLGVTLSKPCRDSRDNEIGSAEYVIRVMEVQAALDLYLIELRRLEDERRSAAEGLPTSEPRPNDNEPDSPYPRLVIVAATTSSSERSDGLDNSSSDCSAAQIFSLNRTKLVEHLARRGGSCDYFDHPLITARSDLQTFTFVDDWQPDFATLARQLSALHDSIVSKAPLHPVCGKISASIPDQDCPPTASARGLLTIGRSVLCMLPQLENLFINGFLGQLICGKIACQLPPTVRSLSLGPLSPWHEDSLAPAYKKGRLSSVEKLFLCGNELPKGKVAAIGSMPNLKQADWDLKNVNVEWDVIFSAFQGLLRTSSLAESAQAPSANVKKRSRSCFEEDGDNSTEEDEELAEDDWPPKRPHIQIRLDPEHRQMLHTVLSAKAWAAHKAGHLVPGKLHPIDLREMDDSYFDDERWDEASYEVELAYGEIKDRWEYCVTGLWYWEQY